MKTSIRYTGIIFLTIIFGFFMSGCRFDPSGVPAPIDDRFDGCWENREPGGTFNGVILDIQQPNQNQLTGFFFVEANSLADIIPFAVQGEVEAKGRATLLARSHANPDYQLDMVAILTDLDTMTVNISGKPPTPEMTRCPGSD